MTGTGAGAVAERNKGGVGAAAERNKGGISMDRQRYANKNLDQIICYFMRTILNLQESGIEKLPLPNALEEPFKSYMDFAVELLIDGQPEEVSELLLSAEYDCILRNANLDVKDALCLRAIKELSQHIHYDEDYYKYILSLDNIWGNGVFEYASATFYPNLPRDAKEKYRIYDLIKYIPQEKFRLDDY